MTLLDLNRRRSASGSARGRSNAARDIAARLALLGALVVAGCGGHGGGHANPDGSAGATGTAGAGGTHGDAGGDTTAADGSCPEVLTKGANGSKCTCGGECSSTYCVDGVCCSSACTGSCQTCTADSMGTCTFLSAGAPPRDAKTCGKADPTTCGYDGTCDGAGLCRRYTAGTNCGQGMCNGDSVVGARSCDGGGRCVPGPAVICAPYSCNTTTGACYDACTQSSQCVAGQQCTSASCGKKMKGANCKVNGDCASGFCADQICCNVACAGGCVSCGLPGRLGTCWPIDAGLPDPRAVCKDQGAPSCGTTGACDGFGVCAKYAAETQCLPPSCTGSRRNTPGTCDGNGTCQPQGVQNCSPFRCVTDACNKTCVTDNDCDTGHVCVKGLCGPKSNGQSCSTATECQSAHCVDGVCCDTACTGACRSCALASAPGKCTSIPVGNTDPRGLCTDMTAASCATNGRCDGSGACQKYKVGTLCLAESCTSNVYKPPSTCNATGQCVAPDSLPCSPYVCNGTACFGACTADANCLTPNSCSPTNSCGPKNNGASCSAADECGSGFCAQGVCCDKACAGACQSCALPGTLGACTNVATGATDPAGLCQDMGSTSCGTNAKCQAGACQKYAKGTSCAASTCPAATTTFTAASSCDGNGACVTPPPGSCFPYKCGTAVCKGACAADADCASPAVCISGSCGLKGMGQSCAGNGECLSKFCAQGVCCNAACNGSCQSCGLPGTMGTCTNVGNGAADPQGTCQNQGAASCGNDGLCDGKGSCRFFAAGTECVAPSCPANGSTLTQARSCDGVGNCQAPATIACAPFKCNGASACNAACTSDADCLAPNICDPQTNLCGNKKRLGQVCAMTSDCLTGDFCVDGVCCGSSMCGLCQACNLPGKAGSCANVGSGDAELHARCPASAPCGNTGNCNGAGACEQGGTGVSCGLPSCSGSTATPVSHCTGGGACATPTTSPCSPYVCGASACKTTCAGDGDCVPPFTCQGAAGAQSCALKKNGLACASLGQCISGNCIDGVCCGSPGCGPCMACNLSGNGTCAAVAAGTPAPATYCTDQGQASCGQTGKCDGTGLCQKYPDNTSCSTATCAANTSTLIQAGTCQSGTCVKPPHDCSPYDCNGVSACLTTCGSDTDCSGNTYCTGVGGSCVPTKAAGQPCAGDDQCGTHFCTDGVCCGMRACPSCKACNIAGDGSCAPVPAGTPAPSTFCAPQAVATCGTNGLCDGSGGCQKYPDNTTCSSAVCASTATLTLPGQCKSGSCVTAPKACAPYVCASGACGGSCTTDAQCATGTYCSGGSCVANIVNGGACDPAAPTHCAFGNCVDGVCCNAPCAGACVSCALPGLVGTCTKVGAGVADPRNVCTDQHPASCGTNGACDGNGGCQSYAPSTMCSSATCPMGTAQFTMAGTCATGSCAGATGTCPGNFMCGSAGSCLTACGGNGDCVPGTYCNGAACVPQKTMGASCTDTSQCSAGTFCVDNVCCGSKACPQCQSCGSNGMCSDVSKDTADPTGLCAHTDPSTCGTNGLCDGFGMCELYDGSTQCAAATCTSATKLTSDRFCDGAGTCGAGTVTDCGAYVCDPTTNACLLMCGSDTDCAPGNGCDVPTTTCELDAPPM
jgi:hypothetical protein